MQQAAKDSAVGRLSVGRLSDDQLYDRRALSIVAVVLLRRFKESYMHSHRVLHIHRDIPVSAQAVIERFAKRKKNAF